MAGWTARELSRKTGVPIQTLTTWIKSGLVEPDVYGRGRGGHTIGACGLLELLAVVELSNTGFTGQDIRRAVDNLRTLSGRKRPLANLKLIVDGKDIIWKDAHELDGVSISTLQKPGQRLMIFPLGEQHSELLHQLEHQDVVENTSSCFEENEPFVIV